MIQQLRTVENPQMNFNMLGSIHTEVGNADYMLIVLK